MIDYARFRSLRNGLQRRYSHLGNGLPPAEMISVVSHFMCSLVYKPSNEKSVPILCPDKFAKNQGPIRTKIGGAIRTKPQTWDPGSRGSCNL